MVLRHSSSVINIFYFLLTEVTKNMKALAKDSPLELYSPLFSSKSAFKRIYTWLSMKIISSSWDIHGSKPMILSLYSVKNSL